MPNRILKESICSSETIDGLTMFQEIFFYRLLVNCDDYGRFDARPPILKARLFPLKRESELSEVQVAEALKALMDVGLVQLYEYQGKIYLHIATWEKHQQTRANKSKYPDPTDSGCKHVISFDIIRNQENSDDSRCSRYSYSYSYSYSTRVRAREDDGDDSPEEEVTETEPLISEDEARKIQDDQNEILDKAEYVGMKPSKKDLDDLMNLMGTYGKDTVLYALDQASNHKAVNIAYISKICENYGSGLGPPGKGSQETFNWL